MSERNTIDIGGVSSSYFINDDRASADDPTLLLIHGLGGSYLQWPPRLRRHRGIRTVAVDLPGHGESGGHAACRVEEYVEWLDGIVDTLALSPVVVAGYSLGGAVALAYVQGYSVAGLVVIACGASFELPDGLGDTVAADQDAAANSLVQMSAGRHTTEQMRSALQRSLAECNGETLLRDVQAAAAFHVDYAEDALSQLRMPVAIMSGDADRIATPDSVQRLHDLLPSSEWTMIQGASHMLLWENEADLSAAILSLMERTITRTS